MAVYYSILNDVIGPVMTGPSSSHTAGPTRIGQAARMLLGEPVKSIVITFDDMGSYPATYVGQGSNYGFAGGLLGYTTETPELKDSLSEMAKRGISIEFKKADIGRTHPNAAEIYAVGESGASVTVLTHSTGGGMFEVVRVDGFDVMINGAAKKTLVFCGDGTETEKLISALDGAKYKVAKHEGDGVMFEITHVDDIDEDVMAAIKAADGVKYIRTCDVILPVPVSFDTVPDFSNAEGALKYGADKPMWQLALDYETKVGKITADEVMERMLRIIKIMRNAALAALRGESKTNGFIDPSAARMQENMKTRKVVDVGVLNKAMLWATGVMEFNSTPGTVVAAPTAGSSGVVPGAIIAVGEEMGLSDEEIAKGMLAAGLVGVFIANHATFGAEVAACQAENGSASAMAAAGVTEFLGGTAEEGFKAAALALSNLLGLVCDPVGGYAELPCINRNTAAAANAVMSANMTVLGYDLKIPLDEVIWSMYDVGKMLPSELRCTGCGGLCTTKTGMKLAKCIG